MATKKQIDNPRYANDYHTKIAYVATYIDENNEPIRSNVVEVHSDDPKFTEILNLYGDEKLVENKNIYLRELTRQKERSRDHRRNQEDQEFFIMKTEMFDYEFVHNASDDPISKKLRRQIRKAKNTTELKMAANMLLVYEVFGIEPKRTDLSKLFERVSEKED